jgi:hypothetical protein
MVYAQNDIARQEHSRKISELIRDTNAHGVPVELGHQSAQWIVVDDEPRRREHFGFEDGISNPDVEGVPDHSGRVDIGNPNEQGTFQKVPVGELILGFPGDGGELAQCRCRISWRLTIQSL